MKRQHTVWVAAICMAAAFVVGLATAPTAAASATVSPPITNPLNDDEIGSILQEIDQLPTVPDEWINPATGDPYTPAEIGEGVSAAEEAAGMLPALPALGTVLLGAGAVATGWQIGSPLGSFIYRKITGDTSSGYGTRGIRWSSFCATGTAGGGASCSSTDISVGTGFTLGTQATNGWKTGWIANDMGWAGGTKFYCDPYNAPGCTISGTSSSGETAQQHTAFMKGLGGALQSTNGSPCGTAPTNCFIDVRTFGQMAAAVQIDVSNSTEYAGTNQQSTSPNWTPPQPTQTQIQAGINACEGGSAQQEACAAAINHSLDPTDSWLWLPDCSGYLVADCEALIGSAATAAGEPTPSFSVTTVDPASQDETTLPGGVLGESIVSGLSTTIAFSANPDPMNGYSGSGGYGGPGGPAAAPPGENCSFAEFGKKVWDAVRAQDPEFYDAACSEAWQAASDKAMLDDLGQPSPSWWDTARIAVRGLTGIR